MKKLFSALLLYCISIGTLTSCSDEGSLSDLGAGNSATTIEKTFSISAPAEVIAGEPYAISLVDSQGRVAEGNSRLVITRGSTEIVNFEQPDFALYSHIADEASIGAILIYTINRNGARYSGGSIVKPVAESEQ